MTAPSSKVAEKAAKLASSKLASSSSSTKLASSSSSTKLASSSSSSTKLASSSSSASLASSSSSSSAKLASSSSSAKLASSSNLASSSSANLASSSSNLASSSAKLASSSSRLAEKAADEPVKEKDVKEKAEEKELKLSWNGSLLGSFSTKEVSVSYIKDKYAKISVKGVEIYGTLRKVKSSTAAVVDELKPVFQLYKLGTHLIQIGTPLYLITKTLPDNDMDLKEYLALDPKNLSPYLKRQIQNIYVFREMLGLPRSTDRCIIIRREKGKIPKAISNHENTSVLEQEKSSTSLKTLKVWFDNRSLKETLKELLGYEEMSGAEEIAKYGQVGAYMVDFLQNLRDLLDERICAVDKGQVWTCSYILERISKELE